MALTPVILRVEMTARFHVSSLFSWFEEIAPSIIHPHGDCPSRRTKQAGGFDSHSSAAWGTGYGSTSPAVNTLRQLRWPDLPVSALRATKKTPFQ